MVTSVLIVEDEPEFLHRFAEAVLADPTLALLGAVTTGQAAMALLNGAAPDVMLVDLGLPDMDGVELIRYAAARCPGCDSLVVTMFADDDHVVQSLEAGATGYLLKDARAHGIVQAIHDVREGGSPISPSIARRVLARFRVAPSASTASADSAQSPVKSPLTERETEILRLVAKGIAFDHVGQLLEISPHTVIAHVKKIYRKLAVNSRGEAVYEAGQMGLL